MNTLNTRAGVLFPRMGRFSAAVAVFLGVATFQSHADDEAAFLATIRKEPAEDSSRLVYADWLDEHGQAERAEFIRLQIRLETEPRGPERRRLLQREAALLEAEVKARKVPKDPALRAVSFRRGFLDSITIRSSLFTRPGALKMILDQCPGLTTIQIHLDSDLSQRQWREFTENPLVDQVRSLALVRPIGEGDADELDARFNIAVHALATSRRLRPTELSLGSHAPTVDAQERLWKSPWAAGLRKLQMGLSGQSARVLAESKLNNLEELEFNVVHTDIATWGHLAQSERLKKLRTLRVFGASGMYGAVSVDHIIDTLAKSPHVGPLENLAFDGLGGFIPQMTDAGLKQIATANTFRKLRMLSATNLVIGHEGLAALKGSSIRLTALELFNAPLSKADINILTTSENLSGLKRLVLTGGALGDEGAKAIAVSPYLHGLEFLKLSKNGIGDDGFKALVTSPHLSTLDELDVGSNPIKNAANILKASELSNLSQLDISGAEMKAAEVAEVLRTSVDDIQVSVRGLDYTIYRHRSPRQATCHEILERLSELRIGVGSSTP